MKIGVCSGWAWAVGEQQSNEPMITRDGQIARMSFGASFRPLFDALRRDVEQVLDRIVRQPGRIAPLVEQSRHGDAVGALGGEGPGAWQAAEEFEGRAVARLSHRAVHP